MIDKPLKSAVELAMERLKKKDADEGVESRPLGPTARDCAVAFFRGLATP